MSILAVIPARGQSKGIPRKNLRLLGGFPLIYYSIRTALASSHISTVVVSSEDDEILALAKKFGAIPLRRPTELSGDFVTLDPVIIDAANRMAESSQQDFELVVTMQPTSPLLSVETLDQAIEQMLTREDVDTMLSVQNDPHLSWKTDENGKYVPNYVERLNRQQLPAEFRETGSFLITRSRCIAQGKRLGNEIDLFEISSRQEAIDIDTFEDWNLCEYLLRRKHILFVVSGYHDIGLGHAYNTVLIANDILDHQISFLVDNKSDLAYEYISKRNYPVYQQQGADILDDITTLAPDIIINDCLNTDADYMRGLRSKGFVTINFEDLGEGAKLADVVVNAMYPENEVYDNHFYGPSYFCVRDEFIFSDKRKEVRQDVQQVLLTFGGVDPENLTFKVLSSIYSYCQKNSIAIRAVLGLGYRKKQSLEAFEDVEIHQDVSNISDLMVDADIAFTSAGRTTFEVASLGIPTIVLCQNERETTHFFADAQNGFINFGLGKNVTNEQILSTFTALLDDQSRRAYMRSLMLNNDLATGKKRVVDIIKRTIRKNDVDRSF